MNQSPSHASSRSLIDGPPPGASHATNSSWTVRVPAKSSSGADRSTSFGRPLSGDGVSTSGSSAVTAFTAGPRAGARPPRRVRELAPARLGGPLLGLLLAAALRAAVPLTRHHGPRGEHLRVVRAG